MKRPIIISKDFYSNCLVESIKAKLKNWKNTRIIYIPRKLNVANNCHFMWQDVLTEKLYEFVSTKDCPSFLETIFEKGHIQEVPKERHNAFVNAGLKKFLKKYENKLIFKSEISELEDFKKAHTWKDTDFFGLPGKSDLGGHNSFIGLVNNEPMIFKMGDNGIIINPKSLEIKRWKPI